jgi:hypothetical protein
VNTAFASPPRVRDFPFDILDVAALLRLNIRRERTDSSYADCPFCGDTRGKMNLHHTKNVFRCNYCDEHGGMLALYARAHGIGGSDAYREICDLLKTGGHAPLRETKTAAPRVPNSERADDRAVHRTYSALLDLLTLSDAHRANLRARGLTDEQIKQFGYRSTPTPNVCRALTERLQAQGCAVRGVPGFYVDDDGRWTVKFRASGFLVPIRGADGLIHGMQIRLDVPFGGCKYIWLSSRGERMGITSGSPIHVVGAIAETVYVTEGGLKADAAHCLTGRTFAAVAGANNTAALDPLFARLANSGVKRIVEAYDMDKLTNEQVQNGAMRVHELARRHDMDCRRLIWNPQYKGIDDWRLSLR